MTGEDLGTSERATNFQTTNQTLFSLAGLVSSLTVTTVGTGTPVDVEFYCPAMGHSAAGVVSSYLIVNGAVTAALSQFKNWVTSGGDGGLMKRRMVLADGVEYTFGVGLSCSSAGTTTAYAVAGTSGIGVMQLSLTQA